MLRIARVAANGWTACVELLAAAPEVAAPAPTAFSFRAPGGAAHMAAVADCVERIAAGEIFQANLCLRLEAEHDGSVADLFAHAMPRLRPAYAACFVTPDGRDREPLARAVPAPQRADRDHRADQGHRAAQRRSRGAAAAPRRTARST